MAPRSLLAGLLALSTTSVAQAAGLPPAWNSNAPTKTTKDQGDILGEGESYTPRRRSLHPWYQPRVALGLGAGFPELLPIEGYLFFGRYFGLRLFYAMPLPVKIRVEMPSDVISTKGGIGVANPAFTINGKLTYGESYGAEALVFPFGGSFFIGGGLSHRRMRLAADAKSPVLVCSLLEAAKEEPCSDPDARIESRTEVAVKADVETTALLARAAVGWFWHVGSYGYFMFNAGATKPTHIHRSADVDASLEEPEDPNPEITDALGRLKEEKEADLRSKAIEAMRPVDEKILPIVGIGAGIRF